MSHLPLVAAPGLSTMIEGERALVWSFRQWLCGHVHGRACHWQLAWQRLTDLLGHEDGTQAVVALEALVRVICRHARRPISYHEPPCPCLGPDEQRVLGLVAACQRAAWTAAAASAETLIESEGTGDLIGAAARLGRLLAKHDQHLMLEVERVDAAHEPTGSAGSIRTLH